MGVRPATHGIGPSARDGCAGCGEALGAGPWWHLDGRAFHERCAPWEARPYPYAAELRRLRTLRRRLVFAIRAVDAAGIAIRDAAERWPANASALLEQGRKRLEALDERLRELGMRRP